MWMTTEQNVNLQDIHEKGDEIGTEEMGTWRTLSSDIGAGAGAVTMLNKPTSMALSIVGAPAGPGSTSVNT